MEFNRQSRTLSRFLASKFLPVFLTSVFFHASVGRPRFGLGYFYCQGIVSRLLASTGLLRILSYLYALERLDADVGRADPDVSSGSNSDFGERDLHDRLAPKSGHRRRLHAGRVGKGAGFYFCRALMPPVLDALPAGLTPLP
jgi:hypothetical protein